MTERVRVMSLVLVLLADIVAMLFGTAAVRDRFGVMAALQWIAVVSVFMFWLVGRVLPDLKEESDDVVCG